MALHGAVVKHDSPVQTPLGPLPAGLGRFATPRHPTTTPPLHIALGRLTATAACSLYDSMLLLLLLRTL